MSLGVPLKAHIMYQYVCPLPFSSSLSLPPHPHHLPLSVLSPSLSPSSLLPSLRPPSFPLSVLPPSFPPCILPSSLLAELPWDAPTSQCPEYCEWCIQNYFFSPWNKISNEPLGRPSPYMCNVLYCIYIQVNESNLVLHVLHLDVLRRQIEIETESKN